MGKTKMVSVFKKLYLLFVAAMIVLYACTIAIFLTYAASQRNVRINAMAATMRQGRESLKTQLDIVSDMERNLISDSRTMNLSQGNNLDVYTRSQLGRGLVESMRSFQSMNNIIEEIELLFPEQKMELSTLTELSRKECVPARRRETETARQLIYVQRQIRMELWYPLIRSIVEDYVPDYGVRVTLSENYLSELLEPLSVEKQSGGFFMLSTGEGLIQIPEGCDKLMECWRQAWKKAGCPDSFLRNGRCQGKKYLFISETIPEYGITLVAYRNGSWLDTSTIIALLVMGGVILLVSVMFFLMLFQTNTTVNKPLQKVVQAFEKLQDGDLSIRISHKYQDEFQYIYSSFNRTVERIQELIENVKEQSRLLQNAELMQLQSQINPHFLYNSFYLIRIMAKNESYEQIVQFVTSLAKYYRFLNKEVDQNISLSKEVEHMMNYIDIQQMRFGDKISVSIGELPENAVSFRVPKLILQPVVENAYNYGMSSILKDGCIRIGYEMDEDFLNIIIEDNGSSVEEEKLEQMREYIRDYQGRAAGHALSNIERRLKLAYGEDSGILLENSDFGGLKVVLRLDMSVVL
ncbi:MAG: histidine kinase [Lachnospiraceae bacterium]|nr:histidine kinase [Lachnospiraceae bacterium]